MESVIVQTFLPYEYIIIDGGSDDGTVELIDTYKGIIENKGIIFKFISEKDSGIYNAMNKGIKLATGDFVSFLNAGDWYEVDALDNINKFYDVEPFDLTYGGLHYIRPDGSIINKMSKQNSLWVTSRNWNHPSMFLKKKVYDEFGFDETFKYYADFNLFLKIRKKVKIKVIDKIVTNFSADGISTSVKFDIVLKRAIEKYKAYRQNGYSFFYLLESFGWEFSKYIYFRIYS